MSTSHYRRTGSRQHGGALLVAMIMLFMLSVMGISVMQSSTLERQMVFNAIQSRTAFQAAESTTERTLNDPVNLSAAFASGTRSIDIELDLRVGDGERLASDIGLSTDATLTYIGSGIVEGSSIGVFQGLRFDAEGTGRFDDGSASASVAQGAVRRVPGDF